MLSQLELDGIFHELSFWRDFVTTERFAGWVADTPTPDVDPAIVDKLGELDAPKVADVGSGVVSILHGLVDDLTVIDPLGDLYTLVFDYEAHGIAPPIALAAENLTSTDGYDVVHMSNALDHTQDPHAVFQNLWRAVKPGGWLIIQSHEREAAHEGRTGFHQHDVWLQGQALVIDGSSVMDADETVLREDGRRRFVWMKRKPDAS